MGETRFTPLEVVQVKNRFEIRIPTRGIGVTVARGFTDRRLAQKCAAAEEMYAALARFAEAWDAGWNGGADFAPTAEQMNELHDAFDAAHAAMALARGESPSPGAAEAEP